MLVILITVGVLFVTHYIWNYFTNSSLQYEIENRNQIIFELKKQLETVEAPLQNEIQRLHSSVDQLLSHNHRLLEMNVSREKIMVEELVRRYPDDHSNIEYSSDAEIPEDYTVVADGYDHRDLIYCANQSGVQAKGVFKDLDEIVVLAGSRASFKGSGHLPKRIKLLRNDLKASGIVVANDDKSFLIFTEDYTFTAPTTASSFILGKNSNGWYDWIDFNGLTIDEMYRSGQK